MSTSSTSSQQLGFFGQATKLIGNMMGSGKKGKPEVQKVLQKAAIAAKKVSRSLKCNLLRLLIMLQ